MSAGTWRLELGGFVGDTLLWQILICLAQRLLYNSGVFQNDANGVLERPTFPLWQRAVLFSLAYFLCAMVGRQLSAPGASVSFWLPSGLFIAVLLRNPTRDWRWLALAILPASVAFELWHQAEINPLLMAGFYTANVIRAFTGAWLVRQFVAEKPTLRTLGEFFGLMTYGGIISAFLGALMGALTLTALGMSDDFVRSFFRWWASSAMSVLVFSPFLLTWINPPSGQLVKPWPVRREIEITLLFCGLTASAFYFLVLGGGINQPKVPLLVFPLWAGLRFGVRGAAAALLWLALLMSFLTTHFLTGLSEADIASQNYIVTLQIYLLVAALVALVPAILLAERDRTLTQLRDSEARYRNLTRAAFEGIVISEQGRVVDVNQQCCEQLGCRREDIIGRQLLEFIAPESRVAAAKMIEERAERMIEYCLLRPNGSRFDAEVQTKIMQVGERSIGMIALRDITARKSMEEARRASEEKFSKAFRASPDGVAVVELETGKYLEINDSYCQLLGYSPAEMLDNTSIGLGIWEDLRDRERLVNELKLHGVMRSFEVRLRTRTGEIRTVLLSAEAIDVAGTASLVSVLHDVTDQLRAETALRASEESLRATIEYTPNVAVQWFDETGRVIFWNQASEKVFGWSPAEAVGKTYDELIFNAGQLAEFLEELQTIEQTGKSLGPLEFSCHRRNGETCIVLSTVFRIPVHTGELRFVCMDVDITERRKAEAEREASVAREQKARIDYTLRLIAAQEAERKRIATELHDSLGQNLLLIKNRVQMFVKQSAPPPEAREQLEVINQLATACIAEARQISHDLHPHQLEHLGLKRALELLLVNAAQASEIKFTWKMDDLEKVFPAAAEMNFYRILQESLNNILKHSRAKNVEVTLERDIHEVMLRITDDGCGFDANGMSANKKGMGLQNIIERVRMLGGKVRMDTAPAQGTSVMVTVPVPSEPV